MSPQNMEFKNATAVLVDDRVIGFYYPVNSTTGKPTFRVFTRTGKTDLVNYTTNIVEFLIKMAN